MQGYAGLSIDKTKVSHGAGGKGTLVITAFAPPESLSAEPPAVVEEKYEIEWSEVQHPLITNPIFAAGGDLALTAGDKIAIQLWEDCKDAALKAAFGYFTTDPPDWEETDTLSNNAQDYAEKILKGTDTWTEYIPIAKKTSLTVEPPVTCIAGHIQTPTDFPSLPQRINEDGNLVAYAWFKTADRSMRTGKKGKWERTEEWTGVFEIDTDLYWEIV
jgi:hypothetical protein